MFGKVYSRKPQKITKARSLDYSHFHFPMLISNVLFESDGISAFKISPGPVSLSTWQSKPIVWKGSVRLVEEEQTSVTPETAPYTGLRLKLELYNKNAQDAVSGHFRESENSVSWAEVWYNPFSGTDLAYKISNDGSDTITMTPESSKYYKVITQLPDTGYYPLPTSEKGFLLQVALGLQFDDSFTASSFSESLSIYRRHFRNFQEKFLYDNNIGSEESKMLMKLTLPNKVTTAHDEDTDDDDFGNFVESSYD
ncbi:hypothetical protein JCM33374_g4780 [Metschnikowia sp. JCM 33374]|nr:hypothetical protein JCM33374_g4780 [Metschnikowia sp. JCM 33374]